MHALRTVSLAALALALAGCATPPTPLQGSYAPLSPDLAAQREIVGDHVRWGGTVVEVEPQPGRTCFYLVGRTLDEQARPNVRSDMSTGRFIACRGGFYDPAVFAEGRAVTITGRIDGYENRRIGEYEYLHPRVAADVVYLWPEPREVDVIQYVPPYYGPYGYYGRPYWWW